MTKKDYKRIADAIARARRANVYAGTPAATAMYEAYGLAINNVVTTLADALRAERAEFSREQFASACLEE